MSGYVVTPNGRVHTEYEPGVAECGVALDDGIRLGHAHKLGRCEACGRGTLRRAEKLRKALASRKGGERAKMRLIRELSEIVNAQEDE